jgi:16S rRNA G1207 methylase RsmC
LILDLGGGSGCYCIAAAQQYPEIQCIVFDLPPVVVVAREFIAKHGLTERIRAVGGDFTADEFPTGADVAVMASNLPDYSPELVSQVLSKAHTALVPGGEMHVIGEMLWPDRKGPVGPALWGLAETFGGSTGVAHSESDVVGYFEGAGFAEVTVNEFIPGSLTRVAGRKR